MLPGHQLDELQPNAAAIEGRLQRKLGAGEVFALGLGICLIGIFAWVHWQLDLLPYDFENFMRTASDDYSFYYYGYWLIPIFKLLSLLPPLAAYMLWGLGNLLAVFFAARVFGGRRLSALLSFQMLYVVFIGQMIGVMIGALGLLWWALSRKRWFLAGLGVLIAATKFQSGGLAAAGLLLLAPIAWKERLRVLLVPALGFALSLIIFPGWPLNLLATIQHNPPNDWGSISLWRWIGPWALLFWIPLLLPMRPTRRYLLALAAMGLGLPYFQQTDLLLLYVFPVGWLPALLGQVGLLYFQIYWDALQLCVIVPAVVYLLLLSEFLLDKWRSAWRISRPLPPRA